MMLADGNGSVRPKALEEVPPQANDDLIDNPSEDRFGSN